MKHDKDLATLRAMAKKWNAIVRAVGEDMASNPEALAALVEDGELARREVRDELYGIFDSLAQDGDGPEIPEGALDGWTLSQLNAAAWDLREARHGEIH